MKKIINGKMYNTDTAKQIAYWDNGLGFNDFNWKEEAVFRKKTGEYFIFGAGGPMTGYADRVGNMWASGEDIIPVSESEAKAWCERRLNADEYCRIFGDPGE